MARKIPKIKPLLDIAKIVVPIGIDLVRRAYTLMRQKEEAEMRKPDTLVKPDSTPADNKTGESL